MDNRLLSDIISSQKVLISQVDSVVKVQEKHSTKLEEIGVTLLRNTITVEEHEQRSTMLREEQLKDRARIEALEDEATAAKIRSKHTKWLIAGFVTVIGGLASISGFIAQVYQFMKKLGL